jgi:hypothetical protein
LHNVGCNQGCNGYMFVLHSVQYCALKCICIVIWKEEAFCDAVWEKTIDCTGEYKKGLWEMQSAWLCQPSVGGKDVSADSYSFVASLIHNSWNWPFAQGL